MSRFSALVPLLIVALAAFAARCAGPESASADAAPRGFAIDPAAADTAVFAGGCFWCMEKPFEQIDGVASVISGFAGGTVANPTYDQVSTKTTGHYESVEVIYDPQRVAYDSLLSVYWHNVDPFDGGGQFCDRGTPYRPAVFVKTPEQRALVERQAAEIEARFGQKVAVAVLPDAPFYAAEAYHQDFYLTHTRHYESYRLGCRRDARLDAVWGDAARHGGPLL